MSLKTKLHGDLFGWKYSYGLLGLISLFLASKLRRKIFFIITTIGMVLTFMSYSVNDPELFITYGGQVWHYVTICIWMSLAFALIPRVISNIKHGKLLTRYDIPYCFGWFLINFYTYNAIIYALIDNECTKAYAYPGIPAAASQFLFMLIPLILGDVYTLVFKNTLSFKPFVGVAIGIALLVVFLNVRPNKPEEYWQYASYNDNVTVTVPTKTNVSEGDAYKIKFHFKVSNDGSVPISSINGKLVITDLNAADAKPISKKMELRNDVNSYDYSSVEKEVRFSAKDQSVKALYDGTSSFSYTFEIEGITFENGVSINVDYFNNLGASASVTTLYENSTTYGTNGRNQFSFYCGSSGTYEMSFNDAYDINSVEVTCDGDEVNAILSFKASRGCASYFFESGETYYITVDADESFSIYLCED